MNKTILEQARERGGFRERFALDNGKAEKKIINNHILYIFRYSKSLDYQDANGATYDATRGAWIN